MKYREWMVVGVLTVLFVASACATKRVHTDQVKNDGFVPLFNGKNLDGWTCDERLWRVEDGIIVGSTEGNPLEHNSFLATEKSFGDFVVRIKVKLRNHNSGIQFRSEQKPDHVVIGYQADVAMKTYFGMLYEEGKRRILPYWKALSPEEQAAVHGASKQGDWNEYEITCKGDSVKMVLNGKTVCELVDPEGAKEGVIALQVHKGDPMEVRFKDISIKVLE